MARGFVYLVAIVDSFRRRVLSYRVSITMDAEFCIEALQEALARYGRPEMFNTDQGSRFTNKEITDVLKAKKRHQHGWQGVLARQRLRRTHLEIGQI